MGIWQFFRSQYLNEWLPAAIRVPSIIHRAPLIALFFLAPFFLFSQNDRAVIDQVVATVGGEIILLSEVQEQFAYVKQQQKDLPDDYK